MPLPETSTRFRTAFPDEIARANSLCTAAPGVPGEGPINCFVAIKDSPVERIVGAAFWRTVPLLNNPSSAAEFEWTVLPSLLGTPHEQEFLKALLAEILQTAPSVHTVSHSAWLPEHHPLASTLRTGGWRSTATRRPFSANAQTWRTLLEQHSANFPPHNFQLVQPTPAHLEPLRALLATKQPSLPPFKLAHGFQTAWDESPALFDARSSALLMNGERLVAACLANLNHDHLHLAVLTSTVDQSDPTDLLLQHCLQARDGLREPATILFHLDDRDPPGVLHALVDRFPVTSGDTLHRFKISRHAS